MTALRFERACGTEQGRLPPGLETVVLTDDPTVAFALGNVEGKGVLAAVDARTGEVLRRHLLPELVEARGRVVVSRASPGQSVLAAFVGEGGSSVRDLSLVDGSTRELFAAPWRVSSLERLDGDQGVLVDGGVVVAPGARKAPKPTTRVWRSRDLRWSVTETRAQRAGQPHVKLEFSDHDSGGSWVTRAMPGDGCAAAFSPKAARFWRVGVAVEEGLLDFQERWDLDSHLHDPLFYAPKGAWYAATRDDGGDALVCAPGGALVNAAAVTDARKAGARWLPEAACVSPDGRHLARVQGAALRVTDLATGVSTSTCDGHVGAVLAVAASPDGSVVAAGGEDGDITVWDAARGVLRWRLEGGEGPVTQVALSPDARTLYALVERVSERPAAVLRAWDLADATEVTPSPALEYVVRSGLAVSADGSRAAISQGPSSRTQPPVWIDLARWRDLPLREAALSGSAKPARGPGPAAKGWASFSNDAAHLYVLWQRSPSLWRTEFDTLDGRRLGRPSTAPGAFGPPLAACGGEFVFFNGAPKGASLSRYDAAAGRATSEHRAPVREPPAACALSPSWLATADRDGAVRLYARDEEKPAVTVEPPATVTALALSRDERRLFAGTDDGRVLAWRVVQDEPG